MPENHFDGWAAQPSELDLMATLAGLRLQHRWADWDRGPFTGSSPEHVSVWEVATDAASTDAASTDGPAASVEPC